MRNLLVILTVSILTGCATESAPTIYQRQDSGVMDYFTRPIEADLDGGSFVTMRHVRFEFHAEKPPSLAQPYMLEVSTSTPSWIFIESGNSLTLYLDGEELHLSGNGSEGSRSIISGDILDEMSIYHLSFAELKRISDAENVRFKLVGSKQVITGDLGKEFKDRAALFAQKAPELIGDTHTSAPHQELGIKYTSVSIEMAQQLGMDRARGAFVTSVAPDSYAAKVGILPGDVILVFNRSIESADNIKIAYAEMSSDSKPSVMVWRNKKSELLNLEIRR